MIDEVEATSTHITTGPPAVVVECAGVDADGKLLAHMRQLLTRQRDEAAMRELKGEVEMRPLRDNARCAFDTTSLNLVDIKTIGFCESRYGPRGRTRGRRPLSLSPPVACFA